jgi:hypothetical protein
MDAVRFVAAYAGCAVQPSTSASGDIQLQGKDGVVKGLATVARYLIGDKIKPSTPELDAQVRGAHIHRVTAASEIDINSDRIDTRWTNG